VRQWCMPLRQAARGERTSAVLPLRQAPAAAAMVAPRQGLSRRHGSLVSRMLAVLLSFYLQPPLVQGLAQPRRLIPGRSQFVSRCALADDTVDRGGAERQPDPGADLREAYSALFDESLAAFEERGLSLEEVAIPAVFRVAQGELPGRGRGPEATPAVPMQTELRAVAPRETDANPGLGVDKTGALLPGAHLNMESAPLRYARAAFVGPTEEDLSGVAPVVLNFVAFPSPASGLPIFAADIVSLQGGHLVAIDLHPVLSTTDHHGGIYDPAGTVMEMHATYQAQIGPPAELPEDAAGFFSPAALWARLPRDDEGERVLCNVAFSAFRTYLRAYLDIVQEASSWTPLGVEEAEAAHRAQTAYCKYRVKRDPARGMLSRIHGTEWTEGLIQGHLFPLPLPPSK